MTCTKARMRKEYGTRQRLMSRVERRQSRSRRDTPLVKKKYSTKQQRKQEKHPLCSTAISVRDSTKNKTEKRGPEHRVE